MDNSMMELNPEEMEQAAGGGNGGYDKKPKAKAGCTVYRVQSHDTLTKIANRNHTTVAKIMAVNPELTNPNFIVAGCWIYIPV